jgi:hypothetical protein
LLIENSASGIGHSRSAILNKSAFSIQKSAFLFNQQSAIENQQFTSYQFTRRVASIGTASGAVFETRLPCEPARLHEPVQQDRHALGL